MLYFNAGDSRPPGNCQCGIPSSTRFYHIKPSDLMNEELIAICVAGFEAIFKLERQHVYKGGNSEVRQTPPSLGQLTLPLAFALFQTHIIFHGFIGLDVHYCCCKHGEELRSPCWLN